MTRPNPPADSPGHLSFDVFSAYERRFLKAACDLPMRRPWIPEERTDILHVVRRCLGIRDKWIPEIGTHLLATTSYEDFVIQHLHSTTWPSVHGAADLYVPTHSSATKYPAVLLACGHGAGGKRAMRYRRMAEHLARHGIAVLVSDNIGQGERTPMGHRDVVDVFACDLSLQGLIVMESMGWLNWLQNDPRFDSDRIAAIGNSGGGTLTLFLGALRRDDLAAVSSSGYPSTFDYIARKEKKHCHCNLVPHVVGELEMWQVYGCIAPKPLLLLQGSQDHFFPGDLFRHVARKTATAYALQSAPESIEVRLMDGEHRWDLPRRVVLAEFLCRSLSVPFDPELVKEDDELRGLPNCIQEWPAEALSADGLARQLSGHRGKPALNLSEVFPPQGFDPACMNAETRQIAAQYEAFLKVGLPGFPRGSRRDEAE